MPIPISRYFDLLRAFDEYETKNPPTKAESEDNTMLHKATITKTKEKVLEEYWLLRGIVNSEYIAGGNTVCAEKEFEKEPTHEEISQFLYESNANFAAVEHNYRFVSDL